MDENLIEIIKLCLAIDENAAKIYRAFSEGAADNELSAFWRKMSEEEQEHIEFWKDLLSLSQKDMIPPLFEDAQRIRSELESIYDKALTLCEQIKNVPDISSTFLAAYRMEFYLLHPTIGTLFHYYKILNGQKENPEDCYEQHIDEFIQGLNRYGTETPEMELLGETLKRLWYENRELLYQNAIDPLTHLLNRRGFFNSLRPLAYLAHRNRFNVAVMMIDIDYFKKVNDRCGHQKGDEVLRHLAAILKDSVRRSDIVGRYGGEEFIIFLSTPGKLESLIDVAEKIREKVEQSFRDDLAMTISIGLAYGVFKKKIEEEVNILIEKADNCLYEAKNEGRNKVAACRCLPSRTGKTQNKKIMHSS